MKTQHGKPTAPPREGEAPAEPARREARPPVVVLAVSLTLIPQVALADATLRPRPQALADELLDMIPDNALAAVYVARPQRALPPTLIRPLCEGAFEDAAVAKQFIETIKKIPGALLVGAIPPPPGKEDADFDFFVGMELSTLQGDLDELVEKALLPAVRVLMDAPADRQFKLDKGKNATRILLQPGDKTVFAYAVKDKIAFGATKPQLALRWAAGEWPERRWASAPGIKRMLKTLPKRASIRVFVNPLPAWERLKAESPPERTVEGLALKVLSPEDLRAGVIDLTWEKSTLSARLTVMLADECQGIARVLARPATSAQALGVFPEDFIAVGRIGWGSAADLVDGAYAFTDLFDETISAEYREELGEFTKDTGVNWDKGVLGNLVGEMAFGVRVDFAKREPIAYVLAFPLADAAGFRAEVDKLIAHFGLEFEEMEQDGTPVRRAVAAEVPPSRPVTGMPGEDVFETFCWAIEHRFLLVGNSPEAIAAVARQAFVTSHGLQAVRPRDHTLRPRPQALEQAAPLSATLRACYTELGDSNRAAVVLDVGRLYQNVPMIALAAPSKWRSLLSEGTIGLAVGVEERVAWLDFRWSLRSPPTGDKPATKPAFERPAASELAVVLAQTLGESLAGARRQAQRAVSMANMRSVGQALYIYANAHKGAFPESLTELLRAQPNVISFAILTSPYDGRGPKSIDEVERKVYVIYRPGLTTASDPTEVILAERDIRDGGAVFLFVDGHVDWIPEPRASELIEAIRSGAAEVRP